MLENTLWKAYVLIIENRGTSREFSLTLPGRWDRATPGTQHVLSITGCAEQRLILSARPGFADVALARD